ncbi:MAG: type I-E CRISPR-associated protein Cas6/Cse3/CasE [Billgrantia sp.]
MSNRVRPRWWPDSNQRVSEKAGTVHLVETLAHGIGRAKAFGCGLLMLRRP